MGRQPYAQLLSGVLVHLAQAHQGLERRAPAVEEAHQHLAAEEGQRQGSVVEVARHQESVAEPWLQAARAAPRYREREVAEVER